MEMKVAVNIVKREDYQVMFVCFRKLLKRIWYHWIVMVTWTVWKTPSMTAIRRHPENLQPRCDNLPTLTPRRCDSMHSWHHGGQPGISGSGTTTAMNRAKLCKYCCKTCVFLFSRWHKAGQNNGTFLLALYYNHAHMENMLSDKIINVSILQHEMK